MERGLQPVLTRLRQFLDTGNLFRFILALILAFALWAWVTSEQDPEISKVLPAVPVVATDVPDGFTVIGTLGTVEIRLQGPRSRINALAEGAVRGARPQRAALPDHRPARARHRLRLLIPTPGTNLRVNATTEPSQEGRRRPVQPPSTHN